MNSLMHTRITGMVFINQVLDFALTSLNKNQTAMKHLVSRTIRHNIFCGLNIKLVI